jgi:hypothetical protein
MLRIGHWYSHNIEVDSYGIRRSPQFGSVALAAQADSYQDVLAGLAACVPLQLFTAVRSNGI